MKHRISSYLVVAAIVFLSTNVYAASNSGDAGGPVTVSAANVNGATDLIFNPSPQVFLNAVSDANGFSTNAVHSQALGTTGGMEYGMANDSNAIFFQDVGVSTATAATASTATDSGAFSGSTWYKVQ